MSGGGLSRYINRPNTHVDPEIENSMAPGFDPRRFQPSPSPLVHVFQGRVASGGGDDLTHDGQAGYNQRMGRAIKSEFPCEFCRKPVLATGARQRTCLAKRCKLKLRSKTRKVKRREDRKQEPKICLWCLDPITQIGRRRYHPECRDDKNRERVRLYHMTRTPNPNPTKHRVYKTYVTCLICAKRERRNGARQVICSDDVCKRARKQWNKKERRLTMQRIVAIREEKEAAFQEGLSRRKRAESFDDAQISLIHRISN